MLLIIRHVPILLVILTAFSCDHDQGEYHKDLQKDRSQRDAFFKYGDDSPLPEAEKANFTGLNYYPPDPSFKVNATVDTDNQPEDLRVKLLNDEMAYFRGAATIEFGINEDNYRLNAYAPPAFLASVEGGNMLFIPFTDQTTGESTFSGGRYLDLSWDGEEAIILDFNKAYHPFCKYNDQYACPEPPEDNHLPLAILAGEKN